MSASASASVSAQGVGGAERSPSPRAEGPAEVLSPSIAALTEAAERRAAKPGHVNAGSLRVRVVQVTDLPFTRSSGDRGQHDGLHGAHGSSTSWLRYPTRRSPSSAAVRAKGQASADSLAPRSALVCILLRVTNGSSILASESISGSDTVAWNEEFYFNSVRSNEALQLLCIDRSRNEPFASLPLRVDDPTACAGFIGKVSVPLVRLPEGEEVEQWYPLVPKDSVVSLRTALRISICFTPVGVDCVRTRADSSLRRSPPTPLKLTILTTQSARSMPPLVLPPPGEPSLSTTHMGISRPVVNLPRGVVDYVIIVGPGRDADATATSSLNSPTLSAPAGTENAILFRYPATDRPDFPLPTKVEWFCFPSGPEVVKNSKTRPPTKLFSFVLVGGGDGLLRCYAVCVMIYHRPIATVFDTARPSEWHGTCLAFLTRLPLVREMYTCVLAVAHAWLGSAVNDTVVEADHAQAQVRSATEHAIADLCYGIITPVQGIIGVHFTLGRTPVTLVIPCSVTIYNADERTRHLPTAPAPFSSDISFTSSPTMTRRGEQQGYTSSTSSSPVRSPSSNQIASSVQLGFDPLAYSLSSIFQHLDVKVIIEVVGLMMCESRILLHSTQLSLLCPVAESLCALIYPFRWDHPYVPTLPRVLSEYLQAPLPYLLGVHSSWVPDLLAQGRPDYLVVVDIDRGSINRFDSGGSGVSSNGPMLPARLSRGLYRRVHKLLWPDCYEDEIESDLEGQSANHDCRTRIVWDDRIEHHVRVEFACFIATMIMGYRECLFFVNQKLPVFNKRRFFTVGIKDSDALPFLSQLFNTQAFQIFLENHRAADLSMFHAVYLALSRAKELEWPQDLPRLLCTQFQDTSSARLYSTPIFTMPTLGENSGGGGYDDTSPQSKRGQELEEPATLISTQLDLGRQIEAFLERGAAERCLDRLHLLDPESITDRFTAIMSNVSSSFDYHHVANVMGVDAACLEDFADFLKRPHKINQALLLRSCMKGNSASTSTSLRVLTSEEEQIELLMHKCLTSVFTSDDQLTQDEEKLCSACFKRQYARDLFVLILMQPNQQYSDVKAGSWGGMGGMWYHPKGGGSCMGGSGFILLARLASALMDYCFTHEDFTNARGMLQVAAHYYHVTHDAVGGFAQKEYLIHVLRHRPICHSLDMWQHACSREIETALISAAAGTVSLLNGAPDPTRSQSSSNPISTAVSDELFFSVVGSLIYDMLTVEVPVTKVHIFVGVMVSTYQKGTELRATLKQLVNNVCRALEMSREIKPLTSAISSPLSSRPEPARDQAPALTTLPSPPTRSHYQLDSVIRRRMSIHGDTRLRSRRSASPSSDKGPEGLNDDGQTQLKKEDYASDATPTTTRRRGISTPRYDPASTVLANHHAQILSLALYQDRIACGLIDATIRLTETVTVTESADQMTGMKAPMPIVTNSQLHGHTGAVTAVRMLGNTLISASRDHTLRVWDLRTTPPPAYRRRSHLLFAGLFSSSSPPATAPGISAHDVTESSHSHSQSSPSRSPSHSPTQPDRRGMDMKGAIVSRNSLVLRGHRDAVSCLEMARQLNTDRAIVASGSADGTIRLWDSSKETHVAVLADGCVGGGDSSGGVRCLKYVTHYDYLVGGDGGDHAGEKFALQAWDLAALTRRTTIRSAHRGAIRDLQVTGDLLVSAASDRTAKVWDARFRGDAATHVLRGHGGPVLCVRLGGPADPNICTGAADGVVRVWDLRFVRPGAPRLALAGHVGGVTTLRRDFASLVSGGEDGALCIWDLHSGACLQEMRYAHVSRVTSVALDDANARVLSASWDGMLRAWNVDEPE